MDKYFNVVQDASGNVIEGATVSVYNNGAGSLATIYADDETTPLDNPLETNSSGEFEFKSDDGVYEIKVEYGAVEKWFYDVTLSSGRIVADLADPDQGSLLVANTYRILNVKDFGAVGDGVTDDTAAIQSVIDSVSGGVIYFPEGQYVITSPGLTKPSGNYIFIGDSPSSGNDLSKLLYTSATGSLLSTTGTGNVGRLQCENIGFTYNNASYTGDLVHIAHTGSSHISYVRFKGCEFQTADGSAITANSLLKYSGLVLNTIIEDCRFGSSVYGIYLLNGTNVLSIDRTVFLPTGRTSHVYAGAKCESLIFRGCTFESVQVFDQDITKIMIALGFYDCWFGDASSFTGKAVRCNTQGFISSNCYWDIDIGTAFEFGDDTTGVSITGGKISAGILIETNSDLDGVNISGVDLAGCDVIIDTPGNIGGGFTISGCVASGFANPVLNRTNSHYRGEIQGVRLAKTSDQTLTTATLTKITWDAATYDTYAIADLTNDRITPNIAGWWRITFVATLLTGADAMALRGVIRKNGATSAGSNRNHEVITGAAGDASVLATGVLEANGTTDYFEGYVRHTAGANRDISSASNMTYMEAEYLGT